MTDLAVVNTLANGAPPGIGHNKPPLAEQLLEEIAGDKKRADALIAAAAGCSIASDLDAANVGTLVKLLREHGRALGRAREARKQPFLESGRIVDEAFNAMIRPIAAAQSAVSVMLDAWQAKRQRAADEEQARLRVEQRAREEEAERAREAAEAAKAAGNGSVAAELDALRKTEQAETLRRHAETLRPEIIRTVTGSVTSRREIEFDVTDYRKLIGHMLKIDMRGSLEQAVRTIIGARLRQLGADAVERGEADFPGLTPRITRSAVVR